MPRLAAFPKAYMVDRCRTGAMSLDEWLGLAYNLNVDGGEFNGKRLLEPSTIKLMFTDQLAGMAGEFRFGLGFEINERELGAGNAKHSATAYRWGGYANTAFEIVPEANLFQVFMRQSIPTDHEIAEAVFEIVYTGTD